MLNNSKGISMGKEKKGVLAAVVIVTIVTVVTINIQGTLTRHGLLPACHMYPHLIPMTTL